MLHDLSVQLQIAARLAAHQIHMFQCTTSEALAHAGGHVQPEL